MPRIVLRFGLTPLCALSLFFAASAAAQQPSATPAQAPGRSDPSFTEPSLAPGVDYAVPTEAEIEHTLDAVLGHFLRSSSFRIIDSATGKAVPDFSKPVKTAGVDLSNGEFNDWTYSSGVALSGMLQVSDATGDGRYRDYVLKDFNFIFDHLDYFRRQAQEFGPQPRGYRRLIDMRELDDCGAMGAALIEAYELNQDSRYRAAIDAAADFVSHKMTRMPDGTLARPRPQPVSIWGDDMYMSVPLLAQMGKLTGDTHYYDDAARQVIQMSQRLFNRDNGLFDHAWFQGDTNDPRFYWGRADGWALMAMAELLSVLPESHPDRDRVLDIYRRAVQGVTEYQSATGLWHQLLDKPDSYLETSASAMFTFAIARGVNRGWISPIYGPVAQAGWQGVARRVRGTGEIDGICVGTTAAYDAVYYYNRPTSVRAMQGYGPTLMAGAEMIQLLRNFAIERKLNTFHYHRKK